VLGNVFCPSVLTHSDLERNRTLIEIAHPVEKFVEKGRAPVLVGFSSFTKGVSH
jgi:hypothetical protein